MKRSEAFPFPSNQSDRVVGTPNVFWMHPNKNVWVVRDAAAGLECWYDFVHQRPINFVLPDAETGEFAKPRAFEEG
jgi:hypothetical protein